MVFQNGVSQIRYRAYTDTCERSVLLDSLKRHDHDTSGRTKVNVLIHAFYELCDLNIPCTWRAVPTTPKNNNNNHNDNDNIVKLELWVFWFDERHTGRIDANDMLNQLEGKYYIINIIALSKTKKKIPNYAKKK